MTEMTQTKTLSDISETMRDIDFCMLSTHTDTGGIAARPMSNNREVDYDGDSWFFAHQSAAMVPEIEADPAVGLSYQGKAGFMGNRPLFIAVDGTADLIRDKAQFEAHWTKDLDKWFEQGVDTPGLVLIRVRAGRIHYWDGEDEGTVSV
ncbi:pyridoxamine 5'-phosphate oxidase family protein [Sphingomonas sp.]|uniref:pyridoxamine 5'-phosphate oxidase family protein n=1 Tax=Sphingomonas sp. TaxID=28214 RepID=UPI0025E135A8|nr:pyridoxamine 5'-phosphate oxidase family protein [Sphingomonas sp.]